MNRYFSRASLDFLQQLADNNRREWFAAHKADYEHDVRAPFQRLLADLQPVLAAISPHFRADPKAVGGSLFRIQRDTRFSRDKAPYKPWQGARLYHVRHRQVEAPVFYVHLQPGASLVAAGLWHPQAATRQRVRQFIFENPGSWQRAAHAPVVRERFELSREGMHKRVPAGFPKDFVHIDDLRLHDFVLMRPLQDSVMISPDLHASLEADLHHLAPFVDYLCAALDLEF